MIKNCSFVIKFSFSKHRFHFINLHYFLVLQMSIFKIFLIIIRVSKKFREFTECTKSKRFCHLEADFYRIRISPIASANPNDYCLENTSKFDQ